MKIYIGSDHAGFELKGRLVQLLTELGYEVEDKGNLSYDQYDDYPDFVIPVAKAIASDPEQSRGIVLGKSGQGEAICANRFKNVRAAVYYGGNPQLVKLSREHNDANVLALGAGFVEVNEAVDAVKLWLSTPYSGDERHVRRNRKVDE